MSDNLDTLPDAQLNELFAVEVAGWAKGVYWYDNLDRTIMDGPRFCTDANAVLPWLEKQGRFDVMHRDTGYDVVTRYLDKCDRAPTFARAAAIALLRAKRTTP